MAEKDINKSHGIIYKLTPSLIHFASAVVTRKTLGGENAVVGDEGSAVVVGWSPVTPIKTPGESGKDAVQTPDAPGNEPGAGNPVCSILK